MLNYLLGVMVKMKVYPFVLVAMLVSWPLYSSPCNTLQGIDRLNASFFRLDPDMLSQWFPTSQAGKRKGVVFSIHGLNNDPRSMSDLVHHFNQLGYDVLNAALYGHRGSLHEMRTINYSILHEHARLHLCEVIKRAKGDPIIFLGYSTGAVLQGNLLYEFPKLLRQKLKKIIWIAPAVELRWSSHLLINMVSGQLVIPGLLNIRSYMANYGTSLNAYSALNYGRRRFKQHFTNNPDLMPPTLIIMNPKDELISWSLSQQLFLPHPQIQMVSISNRNSAFRRNIHHLIIDQASLGEDSWQQLTHLIQEFLDTPNKPCSTSLI